MQCHGRLFLVVFVKVFCSRVLRMQRFNGCDPCNLFYFARLDEGFAAFLANPTESPLKISRTVDEFRTCSSIVVVSHLLIPEASIKKSLDATTAVLPLVSAIPL